MVHGLGSASLLHFKKEKGVVEFVYTKKGFIADVMMRPAEKQGASPKK